MSSSHFFSFITIAALAVGCVTVEGDADGEDGGTGDEEAGGDGSKKSSGSEGSGSGSSEEELPEDECASRCGVKAGSCNAPSEQETELCSYYCSLALTGAEMSCLEAESCEVLGEGNSNCL